MSVWASIDLVACWSENCEGCENCGAGTPYAYYGSHILPCENMPRDGSIDMAVLSEFVRWIRDNPDGPIELQPEGYEPWLRFSVNAETVILDKPQVQQMVDRLQEWLDQL